MKTYNIKAGYTIREKVPHFDDTPFRDEFQDEVYEFASTSRPLLTSVADLGCGSGFKLLKWFRHLPTVGYEVEPTLTFLRFTYPNRTWCKVGEVDGKSSLLICSDVIEHVDDPDQVLDYIEKLNPGVIVISTPDRDELKLDTEDGPPRNIHHVREWNHDEFVEYLGQRFVIERSVRGKTTIVQCSIKEACDAR